ncbi:MAG TPA: hypothetical protein ENI29_10635, partial [bacterium]|nr:hypothetical protein [bacterium]
MAPDEQPNDEKPEETKEESKIDSIKELDSEKKIEADETSDSKEELDSKEDLDTQKELDRLRFHYRGFTLEELRKMNMDQFIQLIPARARRSLKRGFPPRQKTLLERLR